MTPEPPHRLDPTPPRHPAHSRRRPWPSVSAIGALLLSVAAGTAVAAPAAAGDAEARFLGLITAVVVAAAWALAPPRAALGALALVGAAWALPMGAARGMAIAGVGLLTLVGSAHVFWHRCSSAGRDSPSIWTPLGWVAVALGVQPLLRPDLFLLPLLDARSLVSIVALPAAVGLAGWVLAIVRSPLAAASALAAAALLAPGWNVTVTASLVALAAAAWLAAPVDASDGAQGDATRSGRGTGLAVLVASALAAPPVSLLSAASASALFLRPRGILSNAAAVAVLVAMAAGAASAGVLPSLLLAAALVPAAVAVGIDDRPPALLGAVAVFVGAGMFGVVEAAVGGVALLAFLAGDLSGTGAARDERLALNSRRWLALLAVATVGVASYPRIWSDPLPRLLEALGVSSALFFGAALVATVGWTAVERRFAWVRRVPAPAAVVAFGALAFAAIEPPSGRRVVATQEVVHRPVVASISNGPEGARVEQVVIDSSLVHGAGLEEGRWVATLRLLDGDGRIVKRLRLLAGRDTADWAAARPDVAHRPGFVAPRPWLHRVAPSGHFFEQRFRRQADLETPLEVERLELRLAPNLPADTRLRLHRLEVRP
ncbi:MAG: hypothetical protein AAGN46_13135 [Acidobacteriota bacterium]